MKRVVLCLILFGVAGLPAGASLPSDCAAAGIDDRCEAWVATPLNGPGKGWDVPGAPGSLKGQTVAVTADGARVVVAGAIDIDPDAPTFWDGVVAAYDAGTGAEAWRMQFHKAQYPTLATGLAVAEDAIYVQVMNWHLITDEANWVLALDPATGAVRWRTKMSGSPSGIVATTDDDGARRVFVVANFASSSAVTALSDHGEVVWTREYSVPGSKVEFNTITAARDGSVVYAGGGTKTARDLRVVALDATTGAIRWEASEPLTAPTSTQSTGVTTIVTSPDGSRVFAAGLDVLGAGTTASPHRAAPEVVAMDAATGSIAWADTYAAPDATRYWMRDQSLAIDDDGRRVVVLARPTVDYLYEGTALVAYEAATGSRAWVQESREPIGRVVGANGLDGALAITGNRVVASGARGSSFFGSLAVTTSTDLDTGARTWSGVYRSAGSFPANVAVAPDGGRVFVSLLVLAGDPGAAGRPRGIEDAQDIGLIAYDAG